LATFVDLIGGRGLYRKHLKSTNHAGCIELWQQQNFRHYPRKK